MIRSAHTGVLFLDDYVLAVGEDRETAVDIRVIAATKRGLNEKQNNGKFRPHLYHRVNVLSMHIPSLRTWPLRRP